MIFQKPHKIQNTPIKPLTNPIKCTIYTFYIALSGEPDPSTLDLQVASLSPSWLNMTSALVFRALQGLAGEVTGGPKKVSGSGPFERVYKGYLRPQRPTTFSFRILYAELYYGVPQLLFLVSEVCRDCMGDM